jgi:hypothetical protein
VHLIALVVAGDLLLIDPYRVAESANGTGEKSPSLPGITYASKRLARGIDAPLYVDLVPQGGDVLGTLWAFTLEDALVWPILEREMRGRVEEISPLNEGGVFYKEPFSFKTECSPLGGYSCGAFG